MLATAGCGEHERLQPRRVESLHLRPKFGLRVVNERKHLRGEQRPFLIPFGVGPGFRAAPGQQDFFDVSLEGAVVGLAQGCDDENYLFIRATSSRQFLQDQRRDGGICWPGAPDRHLFASFLAASATG